MTKSPAYPMYAADFDTDTAAWGNREVGAYLRLLNYGWINRGIPDDLVRLAKIAREQPAYFKKRLWPLLSTKFISNGTPDKLFNPRQEIERKKQKEYREKQSKAGKEGADKRWHGGGDGESMATPSDKDGGQGGETIAFQSSPSSTPSKTKEKDSPVPKKSVQHPPLPRIDFNFEQRDFIGITEEDITSWSEAFPVVDIKLEIKKAREWLLSNPERRKKKYRKFLTAWFSRTQDKGGTKGYNPKKAASPGVKPLVDQAREWDEEEARRKDASRQWQDLDEAARAIYMKQAQLDPRLEFMAVETVAFLIFSAERSHDGNTDQTQV